MSTFRHCDECGAYAPDNGEDGECRRFAPRAFVATVNTVLEEDYIEKCRQEWASWPKTRGAHGCAESISKEDDE